MHTQKIEYHDKDTLLEGFLAVDKTISGKRPLVIVAHDWTGLSEFTRKKTEAIAALGYIAFAIDMYGKGILAKSPEDKPKMIKPFFENRPMLLQRISAGFEAAQKIEGIDHTKIGAIGICFGAMCVLDLARSGATFQGIVSFHGLLGAPPQPFHATMKPKVLALHGHEDPMVPPEQVLAFQKEMTEKKVDWQMHIYGNAQHAFTIPSAHDTKLGTIYNKLADERSWLAMENFFKEIF